jgi:hypothetical protein
LFDGDQHEDDDRGDQTGQDTDEADGGDDDDWGHVRCRRATQIVPAEGV